MSEHCLIKKNTPELRKKLEDADWLSCWGYSKMYSGEKYFRERVDSLIDTYSDEEVVCADRPEA